MSKFKRLAALILTVALAVSLFAGCGKSAEKAEKTGEAAASAATTAVSTDNSKDANDPAVNFKELKIKVAGFNQTGNRVPTNDVLTPVWRAKTKVIPEIITRPQGTAEKDYTQMMIAAGTLPEVLATNEFWQPEIRKALISSGSIREFTPEIIKKYMPRFTKKLERYGATVEEFLADNKTDGKNWYLPYRGSYINFPNLRTTEGAYQNLPIPYGIYLRDDILKKIFPQARTEQELKQIYVQKGGRLDWEDVTDIPIDNKEQLLDYFRKVKELGMKVGNNPVIPAHPNANADGNSIVWSMLTASELYWWGQEWGILLPKGDQLTYIPEAPEWKDYVKWFNTMYNEGLLDPEWAIQKDDQMNSKIKNGEYAAVNWWSSYKDARKVSKDENRGYGYRMLTMYRSLPTETKYHASQYYYTSLNDSYLLAIITKSAKEEDLPQIYNWLDWNLSDEADEYRYWGTPDMHTGTGKDMRFKPEYKSVEDWAVRGIKSDKDGVYYGMMSNMPPKIDQRDEYNFETYGITMVYDRLPMWVYPKQPTLEDDIDIAVENAMKRYYAKDLIFYKQTFKKEDIDANPDWVKATAKGGIWSDGANKALAKAIVAKSADFEKKYQEYYNAMFTDDMKKALETVKGIYKNMYKDQMEPEQKKGTKIDLK